MTERNFVIPPFQHLLQFPDLGDNVLLPDGVVYPITEIECRGLIIGEWVGFKDERFSMHDFLNCLVWSPEQNQWAERPNLAELLAEAEPIEANPELPPVKEGTVQIHIDSWDWLRLAMSTVPPPKD